MGRLTRRFNWPAVKDFLTSEIANIEQFKKQVEQKLMSRKQKKKETGKKKAGKRGQLHWPWLTGLKKSKRE